MVKSQNNANSGREMTNVIMDHTAQLTCVWTCTVKWRVQMIVGAHSNLCEWWVDCTLKYCLIIWMCLVCHRTDTQICQEDLFQRTCSFIWRKKTKLLEKILDWRWWVPTVMKLLKCNQPFDCWDYYHLLDHMVKFLNIFVVSLTTIKFGSQYIVLPHSLCFKIDRLKNFHWSWFMCLIILCYVSYIVWMTGCLNAAVF